MPVWYILAFYKIHLKDDLTLTTCNFVVLICQWPGFPGNNHEPWADELVDPLGHAFADA